MNYPLKVKKQINQDGFMDRPGLCWTFLVGITKFIIFLKTALFYLTVIVSSFEEFERFFHRQKRSVARENFYG